MRVVFDIVVFCIHLPLQLINMALWGSLIFVLGLIRLLMPSKFIANHLLSLMHWCYFRFSLISVGFITIFNSLEIKTSMQTELSKQKWYLIMANHLSYLDIILLIQLCAKHASPPKFFLKKELIWTPFVGIAAWAMDMPFMRRYSQAHLARYPELRGKDIETTRRSCEKFLDRPTSVINFVEGTRFTPQKAERSASPFKHLMRPKAGGIAFTLAAMGEQFSNVLDVTIAYPDSRHPMMDMLCGRMKTILIDIEVVPDGQNMMGDYFNDESFRQQFQLWLNQLWQRKDQRIAQWMNKTI